MKINFTMDDWWTTGSAWEKGGSQGWIGRSVSPWTKRYWILKKITKYKANYICCCFFLGELRLINSGGSLILCRIISWCVFQYTSGGDCLARSPSKAFWRLPCPAGRRNNRAFSLGSVSPLAWGIDKVQEFPKEILYRSTRLVVETVGPRNPEMICWGNVMFSQKSPEDGDLLIGQENSLLIGPCRKMKQKPRCWKCNGFPDVTLNILI